MTTRPVVVVGDVGLDVITRPHGDIRWHSDTPSAVALVPGGAGGNSASGLAELGAEVTLVARVGDDAAGAACRGELEAAGITCSFAVDPALPTCMVVILLDAHGDRTMFPDRGANQAFSVADVDLAALGLPAEPRPHLHLSGYVLFDAGSRAAGLESLRQARSLGWTTSVDPQSPALIEREGVHGKDVTPRLLEYFHDHSGGESLRANVELVLSNARLAGEVAAEVSALVSTQSAA